MKAQPGMIVQVVGLVKRTELNGQKGLCLDYSETSQRYSLKLVSGGEPILVKSENITSNDELFEALNSTDMGSIKVCYELTDSIVSHFNWSFDMPQKLKEFSTANLRGQRNMYRFCLMAGGHHFTMESIECNDKSVFARVFQAYKNKYSAKQWLNQLRWMDRRAIARFFTDIAVWQKMVEVFVKDDLIAGLMVPQGESPVEFSRKVASGMVTDSRNYGGGPFVMGMQPGKWDDASIQSYAESGNGHAACDGELRGGLTMTHPQNPEGGDFALSYRIEPWRDILQMSEKLFHGASGDFSLSALIHQGRGWLFQKILTN